MNYTALDVVLLSAFSVKTLLSMVKPRHEIRLHLLLNKHIKHPLQAAESNPKKVNMKVLLSLTKVLKLHMFILYLYILQTGRPPYSCELLDRSHSTFWVLS